MRNSANAVLGSAISPTPLAWNSTRNPVRLANPLAKLSSAAASPPARNSAGYSRNANVRISREIWLIVSEISSRLGSSPLSCGVSLKCAKLSESDSNNCPVESCRALPTRIAHPPARRSKRRRKLPPRRRVDSGLRRTTRRDRPGSSQALHMKAAFAAPGEGDDVRTVTTIGFGSDKADALRDP